MKGFCPECGKSLKNDLDKFDAGDELTCESCGIGLIVLKHGKRFNLKPNLADYMISLD